jgi:vacuolar-type H+-ATPase subunit H
MRNKDEEKVQSSLIPGIRQQEGQLQDELHQVQEEARQLLDKARQEAQTTLEKERGDVSASVDRLRAAGLQALEVSLESEESEAQKSIQKFEARTSARLPAAVKQIMALVLPEGKA